MRDISLLLATPKYRDLIGYLDAADNLDAVVTCFACGKVIGVGLTKDAAAHDATDNGIGIFTRGNWFCTADAPTSGHPPVPAGLQKHKSPRGRG